MNPNDELSDQFQRARRALDHLPTADARRQARAQFVTSLSVTPNGSVRHSDHSALMSPTMLESETMLFKRKPRRLIAAALLGLLLAGGLWAVPPLRTFAQDVIEFFIPAQADTRSTEIFVGGQPSEATDQPSGDLQTVIAQVPFTVYTPTNLPAGYQISDAEYTYGAVFITLTCVEPWAIMISQRPLDESLGSLSQEVGASAVIESVDINGITGEYVHGGWDIVPPANLDELRQTPHPQGVAVESVWNNDLPWGRMAWSADGFAFEITMAGGILSENSRSSPCAPTRDLFTALARGLVASG
jgi:hypothetical protein